MIDPRAIPTANKRYFSLGAARAVLALAVAAVAVAGCQTSPIASPPAGLEPGFGHLLAISAGPPVPPGTAVAVEPRPGDPQHGAGPLYAAARDSARAALSSMGLREGREGGLTLAIHVTETSYARARRGAGEGQPVVSEPGFGETPLPVAEPQVNVPVDEPINREPSYYSVELSLFEPGHSPSWTATIEAAGQVKEPVVLVARMTDAAIEAFDSDADRDFVLSCAHKPQSKGGLCLY
jgi:hypothetical protein